MSGRRLVDVLAEAELLVTCGPGGVGKTSTAAALGLAAARTGRRVVVVTIDPARRLADALGIDTERGNVPHVVEGAVPAPGVFAALMLDAESAFDELVRERAGDAAERVLQGHADAVFDSSLVYELAVLKVYAERYLLEVPQGHPAYTTAYRLLQLVDRFVTIYPDHVPPTSLLREFIGGSGFER